MSLIRRALFPVKSGKIQTVMLLTLMAGGILFNNGKYYWFGEHRPSSGFTTQVGVTCYSSTDLRNWKYEGVALAVSDEAGSDIEKGCIIERPKVIYNQKTGKYVMWFHLELKGRGYGPSRAGVAVSEHPGGTLSVYPFRARESRCLSAKYDTGGAEAYLESGRL